MVPQGALGQETLIPPQSRRCFLNPHHRTGVGLHGQHKTAPLPSPTPQETPVKVPPPPQQETQGALVPIHEGDVEVFQNHAVVKVGWRAYLVPRNYGSSLDCDRATCTQSEKCRGGTEVVTRCLDARNTDIAKRVNGDRLTCIFLRVFGKWMTEADILELSR